jgi:hypothetical protein
MRKPQIMSLTWGFGGAACRTRTDDLLITKTPPTPCPLPHNALTST